MPTKKVNAKTKILEFKKKHNLLVDEVAEVPSLINSAIQADKNILSQIVYDAENNRTIFPKGIMPLRICNDDEELYFNYSNMYLLDSIGTQTTTRIIYSNEQFYVDNNLEVESIEYICFSGDIDVISVNVLNAYYLYHPITSAGTKLYQHNVFWGGKNLMFISLESSALSFDTVNVNKIISFIQNNSEYQLLKLSAIYSPYPTRSGVKLTMLKYADGTISTEDLTVQSGSADTVTEL